MPLTPIQLHWKKVRYDIPDIVESTDEGLIGYRIETSDDRRNKVGTKALFIQR
jgi:hypothetical protein